MCFNFIQLNFFNEIATRYKNNYCRSCRESVATKLFVIHTDCINFRRRNYNEVHVIVSVIMKVICSCNKHPLLLVFGSFIYKLSLGSILLMGVCYCAIKRYGMAIIGPIMNNSLLIHKPIELSNGR